MFDKLFRQHKRLAVDLDSIGDTLRYIESDIAGSPQYAKLHTAIKAALDEVERLDVRDGEQTSADQGSYQRMESPAQFEPLVSD